MILGILLYIACGALVSLAWIALDNMTLGAYLGTGLYLIMGVLWPIGLGTLLAEEMKILMGIPR